MQNKITLPLVVATCAASGAMAQTLWDVLTEHNNTLSTLNSFLESQQTLFQELENTQDITILAPNNDALNALYGDSTLMTKFSSDTGLVAAFWDYHVLQGMYYTSNVTGSPQPELFISTLLDNTTYSNVTGGQRVAARSDSNGTVSFYSGSGSQKSTVKGANYNFTGGTVHVIDKVLSIPASLNDTLINANLTAAAGAFKSSAGDMLDSLSSEGSVTVFAPNNAGFDAVGSVIAGMSVADLTNVMGYHVLVGKVLYTDDIVDGSSEKTSQGGDVHFNVDNTSGTGGARNVFVDGARIVSSDMLIANGVIHVLDKYVSCSFLFLLLFVVSCFYLALTSPLPPY